MNFLITFLKGTLVGIGGIAPGLSGSVMLLILGLYEKVINAIGTLFKSMKRNLLFLIPLVLGFGVGVLFFSKIVDFMLHTFEFQTRYLFLGLVLGTVPLFYKEIKKHGFAKKYYWFICIAAIIGFFLFTWNKNWFPTIQDPNWLQSMLLGIAVAGSSIIPGVDSAVILSALGLYELYVASLANLEMQILVPAAIGLVFGAAIISIGMHFLIKHVYTATFSVVFGLFLSIIPKVLNTTCLIHNATQGVWAVTLTLGGFLLSYFFGNLRPLMAKIRKILSS